MKTENLKITDLKPYERNAKQHPRRQIDQIKESIRRFGMNDPIGVWGKDNLIVEGHGRYIACKEMGIEEVPCIRLDHLSDAERKEYTLIHNKTTINSDFDFDVLEDELKSIAEMDPLINMADFDFDVKEEEPEVKDDEYDPVLPSEPRTKFGEIYILGEHRLMCGDSTNAKDVQKLMDGNLADLVVTDPPYNVNVSNSDGLTIKNDNMAKEEFRQFLQSAFDNLSESLKAGGGILCLVRRL